MTRQLTVLLPIVLIVAGCAKKPITAPRAVVPPVVASELKVSATAAKEFGDMIALGVGVSNGSAHEYSVAAMRVLAVDTQLNRIAPLSVEEAARQAGGTTALVAGLQGAGGGALLTGLLGAVPGAIIGAATGGGSGAAKGAAIGAGVGVAAGAIGGYYESKKETERQIVDQLGSLYLGEKLSKPGLPVSGFVFFPRGAYIGVYVVAIDQQTQAVEEVFGQMVPPPAL